MRMAMSTIALILSLILHAPIRALFLEPARAAHCAHLCMHLIQQLLVKRDGGFDLSSCKEVLVVFCICTCNDIDLQPLGACRKCGMLMPLLALPEHNTSPHVQSTPVLSLLFRISLFDYQNTCPWSCISLCACSSKSTSQPLPSPCLPLSAWLHTTRHGLPSKSWHSCR
jgi:hypothetical protein